MRLGGNAAESGRAVAVDAQRQHLPDRPVPRHRSTSAAARASPPSGRTASSPGSARTARCSGPASWAARTTTSPTRWRSIRRATRWWPARSPSELTVGDGIAQVGGRRRPVRRRRSTRKGGGAGPSGWAASTSTPPTAWRWTATRRHRRHRRVRRLRRRGRRPRAGRRRARATSCSSMLEPDGTVRWARAGRSAGPGRGARGRLRRQGNLYALVEFSRAVDFGGGPLESGGNRDLGLVKLDPTGKHLWSRRFGSNLDELAVSLAVDPAGSVIITGSFDDVLDFGDGADAAPRAAPTCSSPSSPPTATRCGRAGWATPTRTSAPAWRPTVRQRLRGRAGSGGSSTCSTGRSVKSAGKKDVFLDALSPAGDGLWARAFGGAEDDYGRGLAADDGAGLPDRHLPQDREARRRPRSSRPRRPGARLPLGDVFVAKLGAEGLEGRRPRRGRRAAAARDPAEHPGYTAPVRESRALEPTGHPHRVAVRDGGRVPRRLSSVPGARLAVHRDRQPGGAGPGGSLRDDPGRRRDGPARRRPGAGVPPRPRQLLRPARDEAPVRRARRGQPARAGRAREPGGGGRRRGPRRRTGRPTCSSASSTRIRRPSRPTGRAARPGTGRTARAAERGLPPTTAGDDDVTAVAQAPRPPSRTTAAGLGTGPVPRVQSRTPSSPVHIQAAVQRSTPAAASAGPGGGQPPDVVQRSAAADRGGGDGRVAPPGPPAGRARRGRARASGRMAAMSALPTCPTCRPRTRRARRRSRRCRCSLNQTGPHPILPSSSPAQGAGSGPLRDYDHQESSRPRMPGGAGARSRPRDRPAPCAASRDGRLSAARRLPGHAAPRTGLRGMPRPPMPAERTEIVRVVDPATCARRR